MAWLSRLPKRRVVSGLDLDDAVPPVSPNAPQDLAQNALDLTCEESATPRRKRLRRRLLEEKENVIFEPERSVEGCPTAASSRTEESMRLASERPRSQDVEPVPRRRLLRHSISEESVIFPDRPDEPTVTGRCRLRQSISEESLIFPERLPQREVQQNLQKVEALEPRSTSTSGTPTPCPTASTASRLPQRRAVVVPDLEEPRRSASEATVSRPATFASLELEEAPSPPRSSGAGPNGPNRVRPSLRPIEVEESQPDPPDLQEISEDSDAESPPPPPAAEVQRWNRRGRQLPGFERFTDERLARLLQERERAFASNRRWHLEHLEARPWHLRALELLSQEATRAAQANALAALRQGRFPGRPARPPWPPGPGGRARGGGARWQHLEGRELTADDYETLLQLDSAGPSVSSDDQAVEVQRLISMLPCSKLPAGARSRECMICLDQMEAGHEVRTLPCMHVFHRECIDKWFRTSERRPICPIDKEEVQVD